MSEATLDAIQKLVFRVLRNQEESTSLRDLVIALATKLDKHHADDVERFAQLEERVDALEKVTP